MLIAFNFFFKIILIQFLCKNLHKANPHRDNNIDGSNYLDQVWKTKEKGNLKDKKSEKHLKWDLPEKDIIKRRSNHSGVLACKGWNESRICYTAPFFTRMTVMASAITIQSNTVTCKKQKEMIDQLFLNSEHCHKVSGIQKPKQNAMKVSVLLLDTMKDRSFFNQI